MAEEDKELYEKYDIYFESTKTTKTGKIFSKLRSNLFGKNKSNSTSSSGDSTPHVYSYIPLYESPTSNEIHGDVDIYLDLEELRESNRTSAFPDNGYYSYKEIHKIEKSNDNYEDAEQKQPVQYYELVFKSKERKLAVELIALCNLNGKEKDVKKTAHIFYELGLVYREKSPDKFSLVRAAALFNAARIRNFDVEEKCTQRLFELSHHIQTLAKAQNQENLVVKANKLAKEIESMRTYVKYALDNLEQVPDDMKKTMQLTCEIEKIKAIHNLQRIVTAEYIRLMSDLSAFCMRVMGEPPCQFTIVGMGSLARKEITPYSDFEHVIVLEEGCQKCGEKYEETLEYFRWYSVIFHVVIINLKETIIPSMAIPSLNDDSSETGDWFFDAFTKRGISFDGMMPHACKFPLGRTPTADKPFTTELIKPVSEMLNFLNSDEILKQGYHLGDILTKTCFVYGSEEIFNNFVDGIEEKLSTVYEKGTFDELIAQLKKDLDNFAINKNALAVLKTEKTFNVKRLVYRSTTLFISAWGRLKGVHASSSFDIIIALKEKNVISQKQKHKLMYAVALACEIRLRVYAEKDKQDDIYSSDLFQKSSFRTALDAVGKTSLINYFQIAYALQLSICKKINIKPKHLITDPNMLNVSVCSVLGLQDLTNKLLQVSMTGTSPSINIFDFDECISYLEEGMRMSFRKLSIQIEEVSKLPTNTENAIELAYRCCYLANYFYRIQSYQNAFEFVLQALKHVRTVSRESILYASCNELAGCCLMKMNKYNKAWFYFEEALKVYQMLLDEDAYIIWDDALVHHNLGVCLAHCNKFVEAKQHLHKALPMRNERNYNNKTAETYFYIGFCLSKMSKFTLSDLYLKESLKIFKEATIYENCDSKYAESLLCLTQNHPNKASRLEDIIDFRLILQDHLLHMQSHDIGSALTLFSIGKCLLELKFFDLSYSFLTTALQFYGVSNHHVVDKNVCLFDSSIGACLMQQHKHNQAQVHLQESLATFKAISIDIEKDEDVAMAFNLVGSCFLQMKLIQEARINFEKSLAIFKVLPANEERKLRLAALYNDLGVCCMELQDYEEALQILQLSENIKSILLSIEEVLCEDRVATLNNIGKCLMKLHRYNEALKILKEALQLKNEMELSPLVAAVFNNIGLCHMETNNFEQSFTCFQEAYDFCTQALESGTSFGPVVRKQLADVLNNFGLNYLNMKHYGHALTCFQDSLFYYESISTPENESEDIFIVLNNLGLCYMSMNVYQQALRYFKDSLAFFEVYATSEWANVTIAALCNNIGLCLMRKELNTDSLKFFIKSLSLYQKSASNNQDVAVVIHNITLVYMNLGELKDSFQFLENALKLYRNSCGDPDSDPHFAEILHSMGLCKKRMGENAEAVRFFEQSLKIRELTSPNVATDPDVLRTLYNAGMCLPALSEGEKSSFESIYRGITLKTIRKLF